MHEPAILFLDEPTSGLDPQSRLALWEIIGELHARGQTILLTTHYMEEADQLCDRVAIIDHGKLLALDTPDALKRSIGADTESAARADGDLQALARAPRGGAGHRPRDGRRGRRDGHREHDRRRCCRGSSRAPKRAGSTSTTSR